jgi:centriolar protein POC1
MLKGHNGAVRCVDFSHHRNEEDSFIVTCSDDKTLKIWNVANKSFRQSTIAHKNWVRSCKFSPDSKLIVSGGDDGTVKLWDSNRCDIIVTHKIPLLKTGSSNLELESVRGVHFHPHGNLIAASGSKGNTHMYDLRCDRLVHSMVEGAASPTNRSISKSVAFHSDGEHVLISNNDGDFSCLDTRTWRGLFSMTHTYQSTKKSASLVNDKYLCCDFSSDGSRVLTGGLDTRVLVWKFDKQDPYTCMKTIHSCVKSTIAGSIETDYTSNCEEHESKGNVEATTVMNPSNEDKNPLRFSDEVPLSEPLKNLIDHVICQLDTMTSTMICLEKRLQVQENELATLKSEYMTNRRIKNHER